MYTASWDTGVSPSPAENTLQFQPSVIRYLKSLVILVTANGTSTGGSGGNSLPEMAPISALKDPKGSSHSSPNPCPSLPKCSKYLLRRCLEPLKAEPQEVFGGPLTPILTRYDWKTRVAVSFRRSVLLKT